MTFLLIDALNLIRRIYAAQPGKDTFERVQSALSTSLQSMKLATNHCKPTHAVSVFDSRESSWRHHIYPEYKAGRMPMPDILRTNLGLFSKAFEEDYSVKSIEIPGLEADDIIATLAFKATANKKCEAIILSTDKSFFQMISEKIKVRDHFNKIDIDRDFVLRKYGIEPKQLKDYFCIAGINSNNIKGIPNLGGKTATRLLNEYGDLDTILGVASMMKGRTGDTIRAHIDDALLSSKIVALRTDLDLGVNLRSFRFSPPESFT